MEHTMYQASIPALLRGLQQLQHILKKAAAHAEAKKIDQEVLTGARLFPDMLPLARQIHIATDTAKGCGARLAGENPPSYEDTETNFEDLNARIEKTVAYLRELEPSLFEGAEERDVVLKLGPYTVEFKGSQYLSGFVLPNFYFHMTTAYNILRHNGVELGKLDFLGPQPF
ncbi:MAG: DUF1993 domain-containing protein [Oleiphilus sp.]|nr:MAG: DUF1993 domain-containing protein [Oleiphilus sp.]